MALDPFSHFTTTHPCNQPINDQWRSPRRAMVNASPSDLYHCCFYAICRVWKENSRNSRKFTI